MGEAIGIRLDDDTLKKIEELSKEETIDRSTAIRKLVQLGYQNIMKQKAYEKYKRGEITMSQASRMAMLTIWEMEKFMVEQGFTSSYSVEDLENEMKTLP
jgi:metal-responsive CopG/Arc/MetJ family transcriptional regulator